MRRLMSLPRSVSMWEKCLPDKRRNELVAGAQWCRKRGWILIPLGVKLHRSNPELPTSALGQKRTSAHVRVMSALPPKADIRRRELDVRFVPKADIGLVKVNAVSQASKIGVQVD